MFSSAPRYSAVSILACVVIAGLTFVGQSAHADSIVLEPSKDNTIFTDGVDMPADLSNGAGPHIFVGRTLFNGLRRGLLAFDIAGNLPAGAVVESVELTMHMSLGTSTETDYMLHRVLADWGEGTSNSGSGPIGSGAGGGGGAPASPNDATWMHAFFNTQPWTNLGGDFAPVESGSTSVGSLPADYVWSSTPGLVADVQSWLDDPASNFGWLLKNDEPGALQGRAKRFESRENPTPSFRPRLQIEFSVPPPTEEVVLMAIKDNTIIADDFGPQELSNGAGPHIFAGQTTFAGPRRGLLAFDVAGSVPAGATIVETEMVLHMSLGVPGDYDFALHRLLADWGEGTSNSSSGPQGSGAGGGMGAPATPGDATWENTFYPNQFWTQLGGDFNNLESAIATVGLTQQHYTWGSTPGMVADVQSWSDDPSGNFGWIIIGDVPVGAIRTAKRFDSREHPNSDFWPKLIVRYTTPQEGCETCAGDVDGNGLVNGADIQKFVNCILTGSINDPMCGCADMNADMALSAADILGFSAAVSQTIDCN